MHKVGLEGREDLEEGGSFLGRKNLNRNGLDLV